MGQYKIRRLIRSQSRSIELESKLNVRGVKRLVPNLTSNTTSDGSSTTDHDQHNAPKNVVIIIIAVVLILLIFFLSMALVFYLRRRKPRRMEMTEAGISEKQSLNGSVTSKVTAQSLASLRYPPVLAVPPVLADYNRATTIKGGSRNAIPRPAVKTQAVPASPMPRLTESSIVPVLPTMFFPELRVFRSPSPGAQSSLARPGQILKVMNATPSDVGPVPQVLGEHSRKMSYTDLPKIRTDLVKKNGKIIVPPPSKPQRPASMGSPTLSRANTQTKDTGTANSGKPHGPRPLPVIPRVLHPGYRGNEPKSKSVDTVFYWSSPFFPAYYT